MTFNESPENEIIVRTFMKELCKRDKEVSLVDKRNQSRHPGVFVIEEIRQAVLSEYSIDMVKSALRGHMLKNIGNDPLELLDGDLNVRLADVGRARCHEYVCRLMDRQFRRNVFSPTSLTGQCVGNFIIFSDNIRCDIFDS